MKRPIHALIATHLLILICLFTPGDCNCQETKLDALRVSGTPLGLTLMTIDSLEGDLNLRLYASDQAARAIALSGDYETALLIIYEYQTEVYRDSTIRNIVRQLVSEVSTTDAIKVAMSVKDSMFQSHLARQLVTSIELHETQYLEILKLVECLGESNEKESMLLQLAKSRLKQNDFREAERISEKILNVKFKKAIENEIEFEIMLSRHQFKEAAGIIPSLTDNGLRSRATSRLMTVLRSELTPAQQEQFVESVDAKGLRLQWAAFALIQSTRESNWEDVYEAVKLFPNQSLAYYFLRQEWAQLEDNPDANSLIRLAKVFDDAKIRTELFAQAAISKAAEGKIDEAELVLSQQGSLEDMRSRLLIEYIKWGFQSGERDMAIDKISEYENLGTAIESASARSAHWAKMVRLLSDLREYRLTMEVADRASPIPEQTIEGIVKESFDSGNEKSLLDHLPNASAELRDMVLSLAAKQMVKRGDETESVEVAMSISKKIETRFNVTRYYSRATTLGFIVSELIRKEQYLRKDGRNRVSPAFADRVKPSKLRIPLAWYALKALPGTDRRVDLQIELLSILDRATVSAVRDEIISVIAEDLGDLPQSPSRNSLVISYAYALLKVGLVDKARGLAEAPENRAIRDRIVAAISTFVVNHEGVKKAEPSLQSINNTRVLELAKFDLVKSLITRNKIEEAIRQTELIEVARYRDLLYQSIFDVLYRGEQYEKAAEIAQRFDDTETRGQLERNLVRVALSKEDFDGATRSVFSIESPEHRKSSLVMLVSALCFEQGQQELKMRKCMKKSFTQNEKKIALLIEKRLLHTDADN